MLRLMHVNGMAPPLLPHGALHAVPSFSLGHIWLTLPGLLQLLRITLAESRLRVNS